MPINLKCGSVLEHVVYIFFCQLTTIAQRNPDSVSMAPPVNRPEHLPDVTVHLVFKETVVMCALRSSREMVVRNVPLVSKVKNVNNALNVSRV